MPSWPSSDVRSLDTASRSVPPDFGAGVGAPLDAAGVSPLLEPVAALAPDAVGWFATLGDAGASGEQAASRAEPAPIVMSRTAARRLVTDRIGEVGRVCNREASSYYHGTPAD